MEKREKELTRAEEEVMMILWKVGSGFVKDMLPYFSDPKPAYNTVSTVIRILEEKGFVGHRSFGKSHEYFPKITKQDYSKKVLSSLAKGYFSGSFKNLVSFMALEEDISLRDIEEIQKLLKQNKKRHD